MSEQENRKHEYLLADYQAIKAEIARRSNLQKAALAALVGFNAWLLNAFVAKQETCLHIGALWVVTFLVYIYHEREGLEIKRLAGIIRYKIAEPVSKLLNIESQQLLPSETDAGEPRIDERTRIYDNIFQLVVFVVIPSAFTAIYLTKLYKCT